MRVCPECGYVDDECWRPAAFHRHIDYAYIESVKRLNPELWAELKHLKKNELLVRDSFVYWLSSRSDTVRRSWREDYRIFGKSVPQERSQHNPQMTLDMQPAEDESINLLYVKHPSIEKQTKRTE